MSDLITYEFKPGEKYPVIMVCADAVVFCEDPQRGLCVAMIKRQDNGKVALPGGFVEYDETSLTSAYRELEEEARLYLRKSFGIHSNYIGYLHFDDPSRTKVGNRKITTAHIFKLYEMAYLVGGDDATKAFWMNIYDLSNFPDEQVHDDHKQIVLNCKRLLQN